MAPKVAYGNLPKAAAEFKAMILASGQLDAESIAQGCSKQRNKAITAMTGNMSEEAKKTYNNLPHGDQSRNKQNLQELRDWK